MGRIIQHTLQADSGSPLSQAGNIKFPTVNFGGNHTAYITVRLHNLHGRG